MSPRVQWHHVQFARAAAVSALAVCLCVTSIAGLAHAAIAAAAVPAHSTAFGDTQVVSVDVLAPQPGDWVTGGLDLVWRVSWVGGALDAEPPVSLQLAVASVGSLLVGPEPGVASSSDVVPAPGFDVAVVHSRRVNVAHVHGEAAVSIVPMWNGRDGQALPTIELTLGFIQLQRVTQRHATALGVPFETMAWYHAHTHNEHVVRKERHALLHAPPLSFQRHPGFVGARAKEEWMPSVAHGKILVTAAVGGGDKPAFVRSLAQLCRRVHESCWNTEQTPNCSAPAPGAAQGHPLASFDHDRFEVVLFVYDGSDWRDVQAATAGVVTHVRGQMKWWYMKRFLLPAVVSPEVYDWVMILDEDAVFSPGFTAHGFFGSLSRLGMRLAQPSHEAVTHGRRLEDFLVTNPTLPEGFVGYRSNFVECGPVVAVHASVWPCVWELLQPDLVTGYGYDLVWSAACAADTTAVVHSHTIRHVDHRSASNKPNFWGKAVAEAVVLFDRLAPTLVPQAPRALGELWLP